MQFIKDDETVEKIKDAAELLCDYEFLTIGQVERIFSRVDNFRVDLDWKPDAERDRFTARHLQYDLVMYPMSGKYVVKLFDCRKGSIIFTGEALTFSEGEKKLMYWMDNNNVPCLCDDYDAFVG